MKLLFTILSFLFYLSGIGQPILSINAPGLPANTTINKAGAPSSVVVNALEWVTEGTMVDDGWYNGFPMVADARGLKTLAILKPASGHAPAGPMPLYRTLDGGRTWTSLGNIKVDGVQISSTNHSFAWLSTGRIWISYRVSGVMYLAYNDAEDINFTSSATVLSPGTNYIIAQAPTKMTETSYGTVIWPYYQVGSSGNPNSAILMEADLTGTTFTQKAIIYTHNSAVGTPTLGDWRGNEVAICETHQTGVEATSKWIALVRTEMPDISGTYGMHFTSTDGANNWTTDVTNRDPGSFVDDNGVTIANFSPGLSRHLFYPFIGTNAPYEIWKMGDSVYVVYGERNRVGGNKYALKYTAATPDGAQRNKFDDWRRPSQIGGYMNAATLGASVDCLYPNKFVVPGNHLYAAYYDVSLLAADPLKAETRVMSKFVKLF